MDWSEAALAPAYRQCVDAYAADKRQARDSVHTAHLGGGGAAGRGLTRSTEDLVAVEAQSAPAAEFTWLSATQLLIVNALSVLGALFAATAPLIVVIYVSWSTRCRREASAHTNQYITPPVS